MTTILGLSAFYHDSAAALVRDGDIVAAAQEERFTRKKHDEAFPEHAIAYCLEEAGIGASDLDYVVFYDKPLLKFDRLLETYLAYAPRGFGSFLKAIPPWLKQKAHLRSVLRKGLGGAYRKRFLFTEHHESHAASAFYPSPFDEAAVLTMDGVGEWATASYGVGRGSRLEIEKELRFPHSLGLLYSAFTYHCGFKVNAGEYKLMGLAPYGEPVYADRIRKHLLDLKADGSFHMDMRYFAYCEGRRMTSKAVDALFDGPARAPESPITQREMDLAASIQHVTEEVMLAMARHVHRATGQKNLCLAGGVALNCVGNGRIVREGPFEHVWVQPAAGDAGGALGAALFVWHQLLGKPRTAVPSDSQKGSLLGPQSSDDEIRAHLDAVGATYVHHDDEGLLLDRVADLLGRERVVGWVQGRMEFGPRALGARSILGDPRSRSMQSQMNVKIKFRESFRPFAPSVLAERASEWFDTTERNPSPYMLLVAPVAASRRFPAASADASLTGLDRLKVIRSEIPAVTHVDGSARLQTVDSARSGRFHRLLARFEARTGCPVLINTSFNVRGEPIVCTAADAYRCFLATDMDALVIGAFVLLKEDQPKSESDARARHLAKFELD